MLLHEGGFTIAWALGRPGTSWVVTDPTGCPVPESRLFNPGPCARLADSEIADPGPDAIRSGWAGERFRVAETCGVLLDNTLPRPITATKGDPKPSNGDSGDGGAHRSADVESPHPTAAGCTTTHTSMPKEVGDHAAASEQGADSGPTPRDEWLDGIDLTGVSDEELIDGSFWRKLMDELVEAELAPAELGPAEFAPAEFAPAEFAEAGPADVKTA